LCWIFVIDYTLNVIDYQRDFDVILLITLSIWSK